MKISKARLQQLILEEVAKYKKLSEAASEADIQSARMTPRLEDLATELAIQIQNAVRNETDDSGQAAVLNSIMLSQIQTNLGGE